ncbi:flavodoxin family protein [Acetanaerobacterium elongatum]|uniref:NADPH-dependent FMN reductase n=1 Tax=Acetanaerobacterium elongatum TaxID=258515 RepID=A0A1G9UH95_9FIRM|nr:flavodoxin family protein [Acetanaerobacterium elongatum]SDM59144.1 NADPH-dependent FMN reductase [Acetanaerobacterium elongatum]
MIKVAVIYGNMHEGSTWNCVRLLKEALSEREKTEFTEFYLPRDMQGFCNGCFSCFMNGEQTCPHSEQVQPIVSALEQADVILLSSPIYALDVSGQMKTLLDHLCYMWVSHRPNPLMFSKVGVSVTTTAGAGLSHAAKTLNNTLTYWGVKRVFSLKGRVAASKWAEVSEKNQAKLKRQTARMADGILKAVHNEKMRPKLFLRIMFGMMRGAMKNNTWCIRDHDHWKNHGWLDGKNPF